MVDRISFSECIHKNSNLIGKKENKSKFLLAYNSKKGWSVKELNFIQLFLRNTFGLYKSTHSSTIFKAWKFEVGQTQKEIDNCIAHICQKQLLKNSLLTKVDSQPQIVTIGNSKISEAEVIGFAEDHRNQEFRKRIIDIINSQAREGDVVLFEGGLLPKLEDPKAKWSGLKKGLELKNWEGSLDDLYSKIASFNVNDKRFLSLIDSYKEALPRDSNYSEGDLKQCKEKLELLCQEFLGLGKALNIPPKSLERPLKLLKSTLEILSTKKIDGKQCSNPEMVAQYIGLHAFSILESYLNMPEAYCTESEKKILYESIIPRNQGMIAGINQSLQQKKRVFVIAGAAHLLPTSVCPTSYIDEITQALKEHRYAIITTPDLYQDAQANGLLL